ncbi:hypothetical protein H4582DRAFT_2133405 [Lactarius indigo]|nr:hypothetical protein H4582DRAFT_2133405 [Lactarius indigo]
MYKTAQRPNSKCVRAERLVEEQAILWCEHDTGSTKWISTEDESLDESFLCEAKSQSCKSEILVEWTRCVRVDKRERGNQGVNSISAPLKHRIITLWGSLRQKERGDGVEASTRQEVDLTLGSRPWVMPWVSNSGPPEVLFVSIPATQREYKNHVLTLLEYIPQPNLWNPTLRYETRTHEELTCPGPSDEAVCAWVERGGPLHRPERPARAGTLQKAFSTTECGIRHLHTFDIILPPLIYTLSSLDVDAMRGTPCGYRATTLARGLQAGIAEADARVEHVHVEATLAEQVVAQGRKRDTVTAQPESLKFPPAQRENPAQT